MRIFSSEGLSSKQCCVRPHDFQRDLVYIATTSHKSEKTDTGTHLIEYEDCGVCMCVCVHARVCVCYGRVCFLS